MKEKVDESIISLNGFKIQKFDWNKCSHLRKRILEPDESMFYYDIDKVFEKSRVYRVDF